ncbi:sirohydrochlorin chelatase [Streptomyces sp. HPF1205]|uniref:sirohydrochlorin chelatase n=1 Tax=Streptomyces sp. HPF1205 TaxID=2873262 RepID=UPI001CED26A3|nr:CbiX/SirB N-terminal domain-containing protein [Streptomyces sp. HPF1205]
MSTATGPGSGLPVRMPRPRQPGRHRRPEALAAPEGAPVLVLAVPGTPTAAALSLAEEVVSIARSELSGLDPRIAFVDGDDGEGDFPGLRAMLDQVAAERPGEETSAVVVPLLAGPEASVLRRIRQAVADSKAQVELTEVLGPHPLLAEALHVRLSEAGLARADRARLFTVATAADGIILATVGGEEAAQAAGVTGLLLAARLAVPVLAAALDEDGAIARAAEQLRASGSGTLALAPCLIGPEVAPQLLHTAAAEAGCSGADALGPYPAVGKLVITRYATALGIAPQQPQSAPAQ